MFATIASLIGSTAFRMVWGEVSSWMTARQDHQHELDRMRLQDQLDAAAHARNMESIKLQHDLGVETIRVQSDVDLDKLAAGTFDKGVGLLFQTTGFKFVDAWKSAIQAALATEVMILVGLHFHRSGWVLDDRGWELAGAVLGLFLADRFLFRRGK